MNTEIVGIIKAIEYAKVINPTKLTIFTDSKSACTLLKTTNKMKTI